MRADEYKDFAADPTFWLKQYLPRIPYGALGPLGYVSGFHTHLGKCGYD